MERWRQIESLFQEALQHNPAERDVWLREACHGDAELQGEVASLLANHHEAIDFEPWAAAAAAQLIDGSASLKAGQRLGPYEILAPIGKGGMGEVYKARDTRLKRDVAIKICAAQFSDRFEREARVIASLNHPNICQLYDVGPNFLVMELVEGENLAGPVPPETALNYARQIAEGLEAAHEKGIVHRDLKPTNIKVTPEGLVKVLDFGLAKAAEEPSAVGDPSVSPTLTMSPTRAGMILGTAPYMSPEQARGAPVDKRADIWAYGCVLYEMLTGKRTFYGETTSDILAAVLKEEPDWSRIPPKVQPLLRRCLVKDPKLRLRDIGDAMPLLDAAPELAPARRLWVWIGVAAMLAITAAVGWLRSPRPATHSLVQLSANLSPGATVPRFPGGQLALSPDGTRIAIIEQEAPGKKRLATRRLDQSQFASLSGTEGAESPFFSPDAQWIAFFADGKLKKIAVTGGSPIILCDAPFAGGGSWGDDNDIIARLNLASGLSRIPSVGGAPTPVTELDKEKGEVLQGSPQVLPGSRAVLFTALTSGHSPDDADIDVLSFNTGERKTVLRGSFFARCLPSGHLVYTHQNTLFAAPFDLSRLAVTGPPQRVLEDVSDINGSGIASFDFSQTGTFVYLTGKSRPQRLIFWLDSTGKTQPLHLTPGFYWDPRFSPDGKRLAFATGSIGVSEIWVKDIERDTTSRLTSLPGHNDWPVWTPDGKNIVFRSLPLDRNLMYWIRADGSGEAQRLTDGKITQIPSSFSPDGKRLAYFELSSMTGHTGIWSAPVEGDSDHPRLGKAEPFRRTSFDEMSPAFSPDGRWLAYQSNETGTFEVYVRPFPGPGAKRQISTRGGQFPIWSRNAHELFFLASDWRITVVAYTTKGDSFVAATPQVWSEKRLPESSVSIYDLAPDGKRFAVVLYSGGNLEQKENLTDSVTVLLNLFDELRRRVPAGGE